MLPRSDFVSAYNQERKTTLMYGGVVWQTSSETIELLPENCFSKESWLAVLNDTWVLDRQAENWIQPDEYCLAPDIAAAGALFYDERRETVLLVGGATDEGPRTDMWEWDGTKWNTMSEEYLPRLALGFSLAYHSGRQSALVFGGYGIDSEGNFLDDEEYRRTDLWEWDGERWRLVDIKNDEPVWLEFPSMTYDSSRDEVILFGGTELPDGEATNEMWRLTIDPAPASCSGCSCN